MHGVGCPAWYSRVCQPTTCMLQPCTKCPVVGQSWHPQGSFFEAFRAAEALCIYSQGSNSGKSGNTDKNGSIFSCHCKHPRGLQGTSTDGWVAANAERLRALPLVAGAAGIIGVLLNRLLSGVSLPYVLRAWMKGGVKQKNLIQNMPSSSACVDAQVAPVVDASSSQSRTDVLVILLSAVLLLTGLQWIALQPKVKSSVSCTACPAYLFLALVLSQLLLAWGCNSLLGLVLQVQLEGTHLGFMQPGLPQDAQQELQWCVLSPHTKPQSDRHTAHVPMHFNSLWHRISNRGLMSSFASVHHLCAHIVAFSVPLDTSTVQASTGMSLC